MASNPAPEPESFSPASARKCIEALMDSMSKRELTHYLGGFNELGIVLERLVNKAGIAPADQHKAL